MLTPNDIMLSAELQAQGKPAPKYARASDEVKQWLNEHSAGYQTKGKWETHTVPASAITGRHFLAAPIPDPFYVTIPFHLYKGKRNGLR